ncbi:meiotic nuclear division protein 1 [Lentinula raphanica]|uniref:Meiotic nuclear division protein 1 n=1 Tax=Lentinula raphanica TaxID=153919 RepID=A0AA38PMT5_9AGAR|nr:meiotic nuclear division protein 1 [Lentinula raphanica]KAJ3845470.1 meiotic nuclear division protein 1 [Lentinula raphanica]KAJ3971790.1 meiotic nuclear division protein 1 [Lentinula raphanica]
MAPRGLSAEEKRVKLLEIFHETRDFYQLKELEKLGPKLKGIVSQSVKEVLQSLVDDGLVQGDKIGSSNFFWSFPSHQGAVVQGRVDNAKEIKTSHQAQLLEIQQMIEKEKSVRVESERRTAALSKLQGLKKELAKLDEELAAYGACDPVKLEETRRGITLAKEAAIRWTENYSSLLSHFLRQSMVTVEDVRKYLEIDEEYEDIM